MISTLQLYIIQVLVFCLVITPLFCFIWYQLFVYRNHVFFQRRRVLLTVIICVSMYVKALTETLISPLNPASYNHPDHWLCYVYYCSVAVSTNAFAISAVVRFAILLHKTYFKLVHLNFLLLSFNLHDFLYTACCYC